MLPDTNCRTRLTIGLCLSISISRATHGHYPESNNQPIVQHGKGSLQLIIEDARKRTWFGGADARQARSGAGIREGFVS